MRLPKDKSLVTTYTVVIFLLLGNTMLLASNNVWGFSDWIIGLMKDGWFANYVDGGKPTANKAYWIVFLLSVKLCFLLWFGVRYFETKYRDIGAKLLLLVMNLFLIKNVVFFIHNNNELLPYLDLILFSIVFLFVTVSGSRWKYECLVSDSRDIRYLQFTIKRPSKFKHLVGSIVRMTPAGAYRALIYFNDEDVDQQWNFPSHSTIECSNYKHHPSDVIKTARDSNGKEITMDQARDYIATHQSEYHWRRNNCDNYWADICKPSRLFKVSLKRKRRSNS